MACLCMPYGLYLVHAVSAGKAKNKIEEGK